MKKLFFLLPFLSSPSLAHDQWANSEPVPAWVKATCCGPSEVHHLQPYQVHTLADGYHIDGLTQVIPYSAALPSQDGDYWGFWAKGAEPNAKIHCFFAPPGQT